MPKINEMMPSRYLKKEDVEPPILVTIAGTKLDDVGTKESPEEKWTLLFEETKPMVLNSTNMQLVAKILGSDDTDDWTGHKIVLYNDPNITFGGRLVGGIRVRAPRSTAPRKPAPRPAPPLEDAAEEDPPAPPRRPAARPAPQSIDDLDDDQIPF